MKSKSLYTHERDNVRKTWVLFSAFFILIIVVGWGFSFAFESPAILWGAVIFSVFMSFLSYFKSDKIVLALTKAQRVDEKTSPELYRLVENLAITAGLPMPKLYIVPEKAPNAFATGRNPKKAVVAVTEGLLARLNRSELEGVISHELSHVGNRDILVSTAAVVLVGFISILADMFLRSTMFGGLRSRDNDSGQLGAVIMIAGLALSILAPIAAAAMQLAISRKREYLADASGALLTRYPEGLASALEKISTDPTPMRRATNTTSHLWIADPFKEKKKTPMMHKLFMTHPPVEERIKRLRNKQTV